LRAPITVAAVVPATSSSRLNAAVRRFAYFCAMVSPCSVMRSSPSTAFGGSAFRKRCVGPPPRLIVPPRPWKMRTRTPARSPASASARCVRYRCQRLARMLPSLLLSL
jgi:hypothetical protein